MPPRPIVYLVRHGQTEWSESGRHTGLTDIPLTAEGRNQALALRRLLQSLTPALVATSPTRRARDTCDLAGFGPVAQIWDDLHEWNYGSYEGLTTAEIHTRDPNWNLFRDGGPRGETTAEVSARADRVLARITATAATSVLLFSSGHFIRSLAARWINLPIAAGAHLACNPASLSILASEHDGTDPTITLWNRPADAPD